MNEAPTPTPEQVAELLAFLPVFERPEYRPSEVVFQEGQLPFHAADGQLWRFVERLYDFGLILPWFDWPDWQDEAERYYLDPERLQSAPLEDLLKLFTLHVQGQVLRRTPLPHGLEQTCCVHSQAPWDALR